MKLNEEESKFIFLETIQTVIFIYLFIYVEN